VLITVAGVGIYEVLVTFAVRLEASVNTFFYGRRNF